MFILLFSGEIRSSLRGSFRYGMMRLGHNIAGLQTNLPVGVISPCRLLDPRLLPETDWLWSQGERNTAGKEFCDVRISASTPLAKIVNMIMFHVISMLSSF